MFGFNASLAPLPPLRPEWSVTTPDGWTFQFGGNVVAIYDENNELCITVAGTFLRDLETCLALERIYKSAFISGTARGKRDKLMEIKRALEI